MGDTSIHIFFFFNQYFWSFACGYPTSSCTIHPPCRLNFMFCSNCPPFSRLARGSLLPAPCCWPSWAFDLLSTRWRRWVVWHEITGWWDVDGNEHPYSRIFEHTNNMKQYESIWYKEDQSVGHNWANPHLSPPLPTKNVTSNVRWSTSSRTQRSSAPRCWTCPRRCWSRSSWRASPTWPPSAVRSVTLRCDLLVEITA